MLIVSCSVNKGNKRLLEQCEKVYGKEVLLQLDSMECVPSDSLRASYAYKYVVYVDSSECSPCYLKTLFIWDCYKELMGKYQNRFGIYFIFSPKLSDRAKIDTLFSENEFPFPVYIDACHRFRAANPMLFSDVAITCMMLDESDRVVVIGNPLRNEKIDELFKEVLEERLGKVSPADSIADSLNAQLN